MKAAGGYGQLGATLENGGVTSAELLFGSGRSCIAHAPSSHIGTEPGEHSTQRNTDPTSPSTLG